MVLKGSHYHCRLFTPARTDPDLGSWPSHSNCPASIIIQTCSYLRYPILSPHFRCILRVSMRICQSSYPTSPSTFTLCLTLLVNLLGCLKTPHSSVSLEMSFSSTWFGSILQEDDCRPSKRPFWNIPLELSHVWFEYPSKHTLFFPTEPWDAWVQASFPLPNA